MPEVPLIGETRPVQEEKPFIEAKYAFLVYATEDGNIIMNPDINAAVVASGEPTDSDVRHACSEIIRTTDMQQAAIMTANFVIQGQMQVAQQIQRAQQDGALVTRLGDLKR